MADETKSLVDLITSSPPGTFKLFRASDENPAVEQAMQNKAELSNRIAHARSQGCFIEVISIRMQYLDLWLRVLFSNTKQTEKREREFGRLLKQCKDFLDKKLYERIHRFNSGRVHAIHGYLIGTISYNALTKIVFESDGISEELAEFVVLNSGEVVTADFGNQYHNRGDAVYHVAHYLGDLRSRDPI